MAIRRWDPLDDVMQLKERVNRLFEEALTQNAAAGNGDGKNGWKPAMDLFERPDHYVMRTDLPGVAPADVEVEVAKGVLTVRGERKMDPGVTPESYLRIERPYGRFSLSISLPESVEVRAIRAAHRAGVIEVVLPKRSHDDGEARIKVDVE
jgi:HSP20 family protein